MKQPVKFDAGLAFMFETCFTLRLSEWALQAPHLETDYVDCWARLPKLFTTGLSSSLPGTAAAPSTEEKDG